MNRNGWLLILVIALGVINVVIQKNDFSFKSIYKSKDVYVSPIGPKPDAAWEHNWEAERSR